MPSWTSYFLPMKTCFLIIRIFYSVPVLFHLYMLFFLLSELGQLSGVAAILRYPMPDEDDESDED